jgi:hypothetical protein
VLSVLLRANITILGPGRLCNLSYTEASGAGSGGSAAQGADGALLSGVTAARSAVASVIATGGGNASTSLLATALSLAGGAMVAERAITSHQLQVLIRWTEVYTWSLQLAAGAVSDFFRKPAPSSPSPSRRPQPPSTGSPAVAPVGGAIPVGAPLDTPPTAPALPDLPLPNLAPTPRPSLPHCYADHHNVRDILLVVNFNDWRITWGTKNMESLLAMHGSSFPGIVAYTSKEMPEVKPDGVPAINLHFCPGGTGNADGLRAQKCTGLALTRYSGHLGYLIISECTCRASSLWGPLTSRLPASPLP